VGERAVPCETVAAFLGQRASGDVMRSSCPWPTRGVAMQECLPDFVTAGLRETLPLMMRKLPALASGILVGVETRTSSPVRIERGETMESTTLAGLYPVGEGSGHAGGIVSSAIDGARAADAYVERLGGGLLREFGEEI
jgi:uncharacterized FAD-dependent dehydrogenase